MSTPTVLLHGWGFTPALWQPVIGALVNAGMTPDEIIAPPLPLTDHTDLDETIAQIAAMLPTRFHLVGWSLGGELALALTNALPERVASLMLISSTPCFMKRDDWTAGQPSSLLDDFEHRLAENPGVLVKRFTTLIRHGDAEATRNRALGDGLAQMAETSALRLANGLKLLRAIDLRHMPAPISAPFTVVHGNADAVVPFAAADALRQWHHAHLIMIDCGSHALPCTHPAEMASAILGARSRA